MTLFRRATNLWQARRFLSARTRPRIALALGGGGVIGGMYEVGALAALEERLHGEGHGFDLYVGCSAGSVVAKTPDPLNFRRNAVFASDAFRGAAARFGKLVWG